MNFEAMFFDLDDTLYPPTTGIWQAIGLRMNQYLMERMNFKPEEVAALRDKLFYEYGTTFRGLRQLYQIDPGDFLNFVHDIPLDQYLTLDEALIRTLEQFCERKVVFTNASSDHAERTLEILGIRKFFSQIIDVMQMEPFCKPFPAAYQKAMVLAQITEPERCVIIDDSARNLRTASEMGFFTIQVGTDKREAYVDAAIASIYDLATIIPATFSIEREATQ